MPHHPHSQVLQQQLLLEVTGMPLVLQQATGPQHHLESGELLMPSQLRAGKSDIEGYVHLAVLHEGKP